MGATADIQSFFSGLSSAIQTVAKHQKELKKLVAPDFVPMLHFSKVGENKISEVLAFFLNPNQTHGQASLYLDLFLKKVGLRDKVSALDEVKVITEYHTSANRRIDLYICFERDNFGIGIENKIYAGDQEDQVSHYLSTLAELHQNECVLFYLTPFGHSPSEFSIAKAELELQMRIQKLRLLNHRDDITYLVREWAIHTEADSVRHFLKQFLHVLNHQLYGNTSNTMIEAIQEYITTDATKLQLAMDIASTVPHYLDESHSVLQTQIVNLA